MDNGYSCDNDKRMVTEEWYNGANIYNIWWSNFDNNGEGDRDTDTSDGGAEDFQSSHFE